MSQHFDNDQDPNATIEDIEARTPMVGVNDVKPTSVKRGLATFFLLFVVLVGFLFIYFKFIHGSKSDSAKEIPKSEQLQSSVPMKLFENAPPPPPEAPQEAQVPIALDDGSSQVPAAQAASAPPPPRPRLDKSASGLMVTQPSAAASLAGDPGQPSLTGSGGPLNSLLSGTRTGQSQAAFIGDRNFLLAKGAFIDCVLQTRLDTSLPGMSSCVVTRNIFSDNGKVLLIERGSTVTGEYQQAVQQGMNRIFVLWTRIKTPNGVIISLDSPGTDPLGGSGLPGKVNRHFWQRFGAAMLLSLIDDTAGALVNSTNSDGGDTISYGNTSQAANDMATKTLEKTIDIPPTLTKNQGERINIFVARDLNFGAVYALSSQ